MKGLLFSCKKHKTCDSKLQEYFFSRLSYLNCFSKFKLLIFLCRKEVEINPQYLSQTKEQKVENLKISFVSTYVQFNLVS